MKFKKVVGGIQIILGILMFLIALSVFSPLLKDYVGGSFITNYNPSTGPTSGDVAVSNVHINGTNEDGAIVYSAEVLSSAIYYLARDVSNREVFTGYFFMAISLALILQGIVNTKDEKN